LIVRENETRPDWYSQKHLSNTGVVSGLVESIPFESARAEPFVLFAGRPAAQRAADARGAGALLLLKLRSGTMTGLSATGLMPAIMAYLNTVNAPAHSRKCSKRRLGGTSQSATFLLESAQQLAKAGARQDQSATLPFALCTISVANEGTRRFAERAAGSHCLQTCLEDPRVRLRTFRPLPHEFPVQTHVFQVFSRTWQFPVAC
jgi:hypothetical protein